MEEQKLTPESLSILREREGEIISIIESFNTLEQSKEWDTVKRLVYGKSLASIERQIMGEAQKFPINIDRLYKLQGELDWAKRFSDTSKYIESLRRELVEVKKVLKQNE